MESTPQRTVADVMKDFSEIGNLAKSAKSAAEHATDFELPIYNVWKKTRLETVTMAETPYLRCTSV